MEFGSKMNKRLGTSLGKIFGEEAVKEDKIGIDSIIKDKNQKEDKEIKIEVKSRKTNENNEKNVYSNAEIVKKEIDETQIENLDDTNVIEKTGTPFMVKTSLIQPNKEQPRKNFDEEKITELSKSIANYGIITPLIVKKAGQFYEIIAGERRWRAAKQAGLSELPVVIKQYDEKTSKEVSIIENIQREDLNAVEEALAYQSLIEEYGLTQDEVAKRVSKNRSTITNALRILKLNPLIQELIKNGQLSSGHARALLSIDDEKLRERIAQRVIEEKISVRDIEKLVRLNGLGQYRNNKRAQEKQKENEQLKIIEKELEKELKGILNTKVKIVSNEHGKGKIEIEYYSTEDLDRIICTLKKLQA